MKKFFMPAAIMLLTIGTYAGTVSVTDAQNVALNFFKVTKNPSASMTVLKYTQTGPNNTVDFFVFDMSPVKGFVIVAGDDNIRPILAYSTETNFNVNFKHTGVVNWMAQTSKTIRSAVQHGVSANTAILAQWAAYRQGQNPNVQRSGSNDTIILCATTWDQENDITSPPPFIYNLYCPYYAADSQRALTGCVATSMAQIMKFWNYPATGTGSFSYVDNMQNGYSNNYGTQSTDFAAHTYLWDSMPAVLTNSTTGAADSAVDLLMYDCAVSVGMDFGDDNQDGSGANALLSEELQYGDSFSSQTAFVWYFGYDADTIRGIYRSSYTDSAWIAVIEHEINMGRPLIYEGFDTIDADGGGHAWVCDGYDANDNLHMNWGWGGWENGYFAINNLTTPGPFNPVSENDALIGILPKRANATTGINPLNNVNSFAVYPNPAANNIVIQTTGGSNEATWSIINLVGQELLAGNLTSAQTHINTSSLATGVYFVEMRDGANTATKKLVITR